MPPILPPQVNPAVNEEVLVASPRDRLSPFVEFQIRATDTTTSEARDNTILTWFHPITSCDPGGNVEAVASNTASVAVQRQVDDICADVAETAMANMKKTQQYLGSEMTRMQGNLAERVAPRDSPLAGPSKLLPSSQPATPLQGSDSKMEKGQSRYRATGSGSSSSVCPLPPTLCNGEKPKHVKLRRQKLDTNGNGIAGSEELCKRK
ncbi:hypothetical protein B0J13DRAFT_518087 [Dactylonectria estremocensis]|uniref:Uncharacterized protein n=1 Tax=Dactylonectria estremocensis TaxID=1079267 RepID=A0A9P9JIM8_9HYPO|nr:hypothetical protein B0J13DRAFT_518087 [Dactylonectria estremocensis]